jgi:hypothetical protein
MNGFLGAFVLNDRAVEAPPSGEAFARELAKHLAA